MEFDGTLEWWETPLSNGHKRFLITHGAWFGGRFVVHIDCTAPDGMPEQWICSIEEPIWVRIAGDEFFEAGFGNRLPTGPFRAPFFRVANSKVLQHYEQWLRGAYLNPGQVLNEYLISSDENELHMLTVGEPTFRKLRPSSN